MRNNLPDGWDTRISDARDQMDFREGMRRADRQAAWITLGLCLLSTALVFAASWLAHAMGYWR